MFIPFKFTVHHLGMALVIEVLVLLLSNYKEWTSIVSAEICPKDVSHIDLVPLTFIYHICSLSEDIWSWHLIKCMVKLRHKYVEDGVIFCKFFRCSNYFIKTKIVFFTVYTILL